LSFKNISKALYRAYEIFNYKSQGADVFMEIWNQKGFEVDACGNATRCIAWLVMEEEGSDSMVLETNDGLLLCGRAKDNEAGDPQISVDMGPPKRQA